jgi:hypothetical protein
VPGDTVTIDGYSFRVERVADRAIESVSRHAGRRRTTDEAQRMTNRAVPSRSSPRWRSSTRSSWRRSSPSSARRAPTSTTMPRRAAGWRRAWRASWPEPRRQDRYIATTQVGISAASLGLGMYGEQVIAGYVEVWLAPLDTMRWVATHALSSGIAWAS